MHRTAPAWRCREAREKLSRRPWRVDDFDAFCERVYGPGGSQGGKGEGGRGVGKGRCTLRQRRATPNDCPRAVPPLHAWCAQLNPS
jgi:hypothetical protein